MDVESEGVQHGHIPEATLSLSHCSPEVQWLIYVLCLAEEINNGGGEHSSSDLHGNRCCRFILAAILMDHTLAHLASLSQKDKGPAYLSLLSDLFADPTSPNLPQDVHTLVNHVVNQDNASVIIIGRQILSELVKSLPDVLSADPHLRKHIVQDVLATLQPRLASYEEQVSALLCDYRSLHVSSSSVRRVTPFAFNSQTSWRWTKSGTRLPVSS